MFKNFFMTRKFSIVAVSLSVAMLSGCTTQALKPFNDTIEPGLVCIVPDNSPRKVAYNMTIKAMEEKGFTVREVDWDKVEKCRDVLNMQSKFQWDMAYFASDLHIKYARDQKVIAESKYHCVSGLNFSKFINTKEKVYDMLNKMLPNTRKLNSRYEPQIYDSMQFGNLKPEKDEMISNELYKQDEIN